MILPRDNILLRTHIKKIAPATYLDVVMPQKYLPKTSMQSFLIRFSVPFISSFVSGKCQQSVAKSYFIVIVPHLFEAPTIEI